MDTTKEKTIIELDEFARHITLYAKTWYPKNELMEDLRIIISIISGIEKKYISAGNVYGVVMDTFLRLSIHENNRTDIFWKELFEKHWLYTKKKELVPEDLITYLIGFISTIKIFNRYDDKIIILGKIDEKIVNALTISDKNKTAE